MACILRSSANRVLLAPTVLLQGSQATQSCAQSYTFVGSALKMSQLRLCVH